MNRFIKHFVDGVKEGLMILGALIIFALVGVLGFSIIIVPMLLNYYYGVPIVIDILVGMIIFLILHGLLGKSRDR